MRRVLATLLMLLASAGCAADHSPRVVRVSDGDTLTVAIDGKRRQHIRLYGIDAPEIGQDFGGRARQAASGLALGKAVTVLPRRTDRYGRTVADVYLPDGRSLNREMVRQGMAWWYRGYAPHDRELARLEAEAKAHRRGLWGRPNPVPPWEWRHDGGVAATAGVIGNRSTGVYHRGGCPGAASIGARNRVAFASEAEAEESGYRRAGDCR